MGQLIKTGTKQVPDTELRRIAVPTALLCGTHDRFVPLGLAEGASARLGWPLHAIDDAGHLPHIERTDAFVDRLHAALAEKSKARSSDSSLRREPASRRCLFGPPNRMN
jgi:pimeloyl-ACP methyl ester carboxylesterase